MWKGRPIHYRAGTSDCRSIYEILLAPHGDYAIPQIINPKVILDIGANIGIASIFFADRFPESRIFSFEPMEENFELLRKNIALYPNIRAFMVALGEEEGSKEIFFSDNPKNYGGFSFYPNGSNIQLRKKVEMKHPLKFLAQIGLERIDLIKIDTEGAEYGIFTAMDSNLLKQTQWIVGELHGFRDFEVLSFLSQWFDISVKKTLRKRLFMFNACNKNFRYENQ